MAVVAALIPMAAVLAYNNRTPNGRELDPSVDSATTLDLQAQSPAIADDQASLAPPTRSTPTRAGNSSLGATTPPGFDDSNPSAPLSTATSNISRSTTAQATSSSTRRVTTTSRPTTTTTAPPTTVAVDCAITIDNRTWVYQEPHGDSRKLERIEPATYTATAIADTTKIWYLIQTPTNTGWVSANSTSTPCPSA